MKQINRFCLIIVIFIIYFAAQNQKNYIYTLFITFKFLFISYFLKRQKQFKVRLILFSKIKCLCLILRMKKVEKGTTIKIVSTNQNSPYPKKFRFFSIHLFFSKRAPYIHYTLQKNQLYRVFIALVLIIYRVIH